MSTHASRHPTTPPHAAGGNGKPRLDASILSAGRLTELRDWAARLCASPAVFLTEARCLGALVDRLGSLILSAGGRPPPVTTSPGDDWVTDLAKLPQPKLAEIRGYAGKLHGSLAVTPAENARLDRIIARIDHAIRLRHEIEQYWAERGEPMPAHLTYQPTPTHRTPRHHKS